MSSIKVWAQYHAAAILCAMIAVVFLQSARPLALVGLGSFGLYALVHHHKLGVLKAAANWVTGVRLLTACVVGWFYPSLGYASLFVLGVGILLTDFLDGYVAKKQGTTSEFGAYFDMETDAYFIALYASILYVLGFAGWWILLLGLMRFLNVVALVLLRQLHKPEPRFFAARVIAVMVMIAVVAPFVAPMVLYTPYLVLTVVLLTLSFGYTFSYQVLSSA